MRSQRDHNSVIFKSTRLGAQVSQLRVRTLGHRLQISERDDVIDELYHKTNYSYELCNGKSPLRCFVFKVERESESVRQPCKVSKVNCVICIVWLNFEALTQSVYKSSLLARDAWIWDLTLIADLNWAHCILTAIKQLDGFARRPRRSNAIQPFCVGTV